MGRGCDAPRLAACALSMHTCAAAPGAPEVEDLNPFAYPPILTPGGAAAASTVSAALTACERQGALMHAGGLIGLAPAPFQHHA